MVFPKVDERWLELKKARLSVLQRALLDPPLTWRASQFQSFLQSYE